jgi:hypothetical protein
MSHLTPAQRGKRNTLAAVAVAASPIIAILSGPASGVASPVRTFVETFRRCIYRDCVTALRDDRAQVAG